MKDPLYTLKRYKIVNKKLRQPKTKIVADLDFLPIAEKYNCRFEYQEYTSIEPKFMTIDDVKINIDWDGLYHLKDRPIHQQKQYDWWICPGVLLEPNPNVIGTPWCNEFWMVDLIETKSIEDRQGWSCVSRKSRLNRDIINDILGENYRHMFDEYHYYQYDLDQNCTHDLSKHMMRPKTTKHSPRPFIFMQKLKDIPGNHIHLGPWHNDTLCELIPETATDFFFPTEKTVKPIAAGMPFVMIGCKGFMRKLNQMGFKTFHPFIDESYDTIDDLKLRCDTAIKSFFDFVQSPVNLKEIQKICNHNKVILNKIRYYDRNDRLWKKLRRFIKF